MTKSKIALVLTTTLAWTQTQGAVMSFSDFLSFDAATNTTLVEDFEAFTPKDTVLASFTSNGNTYTGLAGSPIPNVWVASAGYTNFGVPVTASAVLTANGDEDFTVDFGSPTVAVGFDTYINAFGDATVQVFGASGLLDTIIHSHDPTTVGFLGLLANEPITQIRWTTVNGGAINTGIDNILQGVAVPTPATLGLLALGLFAVGARGQGRKLR